MQTTHHQMVRKPLGSKSDGLVDIISCSLCACRTCQSAGSGFRFVFVESPCQVVTLSRLLPRVSGMISLAPHSAGVKIQGSYELFTSPVSNSPNVHTKMLLGNFLNLLVFRFFFLILQRNMEKELVIDSKMSRL